MQKYWVVSFGEDWADEFDVYFFDIYTDTEKNNLNWLGQKFPNVKLDYYFGTNEYWEEEDGFRIEVRGQEATEEEVNVLCKFGIQGESLKDRFEDFVWSLLDERTRNKWKKEYGSLIDVPEEVFQAYDFKLKDY